MSVVVPVFNEEPVLSELIERTVKACESSGSPYEIIFVDDGSSDKSVEMLSAASEKYPDKVVTCVLNRNYGQHSAIMAGFAEARGEIIITIDADLQNPPEEIPKLIAKMLEGYDVVGTVRKNRQDTIFRRIASKIVNRAARAATGVNMHDYGCMLRAYRKHVVKAMMMCHERSTFIPVLGNSFARHTCEIDVEHSARAAGESKYSLWKLINLQFNLLTSMTTFPLRLLSVVGLMISAMGVGFGILLLVLRFIYGAEWSGQGVFTLFAILFIFIGAQFVAMGLLGEYIGRIYNDVRARPRFFVQDIKGRKQ